MAAAAIPATDIDLAPPADDEAELLQLRKDCRSIIASDYPIFWAKSADAIEAIQSVISDGLKKFEATWKALADTEAETKEEMEGPTPLATAPPAAAEAMITAGRPSIAAAGVCPTCQQPITKPIRCMKCITTRYCSVECLTRDAAEHARVCRPTATAAS